MPITVHVPEGLFTSDQEDEIFLTLTKTILEINGVTDNAFANRHLIGDVQVVPKGKSFANSKKEPYVNITLRVPTFSLDNMGKRQAFVTKMTDYVQNLAGGKLERDRIYINMVWGDGFWGVGGIAFSDDVIVETAMASGKTPMAK